MRSPKLWCCGITFNKVDKIKKLVEVTAPYVDGFVWTDHYSTDGTFEVLNDNKKEGRIFQREWRNDHDEAANYYLHAGVMRNYDWFLFLDSTDLPNKEWIQTIRIQLEILQNNKINCVYLDHPLLIRYFDFLHFEQTPHQGLTGIQPEVLFLERLPGYKKENYIINTRDIDVSGLLNPVKYYWVYSRSNHTQLLYGQFGEEIYQYHENRRIWFRLYCENVLNIPLTLDGLENYFRAGNYTEEFIDQVELEVNLKDFFRYKILKQHFLKEIVPKRFNWSFKHYLKTGDITQENTNYVSNWNIYKQKAGLSIEP